MTRIAIYMEGGGDRSRGRDAIRRGMDTFLATLKQAARDKSLKWKLVACGSRDDAYRGFRNAVETDPQSVNLLLVDSEQPVANGPRQHLRARDRWDVSGTPESRLHLMVQTMETWIIADPACLAAYYGQGFRPNSLPQRTDLEAEPKRQVAASLREATAHTTKGVYHKIRHASDLLEAIDPDAVRHRCRHCDRLFNELARLIEAA
ncbi:DUF4276 family protein [Candidatus Palauibacter soopunensis]|uniref:DUF4276 family protein n=1 Tax=Candidatus Palauibacter soopunensis TaxID=3056739 RepID=UPI00238D3735|nr:DUF4276 family protein [Candidatus Palauibacter soopunensis]MDE2878629.1 DUF4276 family protein [Candidatus Palauibacter soopunensis]